MWNAAKHSGWAFFLMCTPKVRIDNVIHLIKLSIKKRSTTTTTKRRMSSLLCGSIGCYSIGWTVHSTRLVQLNEKMNEKIMSFIRPQFFRFVWLANRESISQETSSSISGHCKNYRPNLIYLSKFCSQMTIEINWIFISCCWSVSIRNNESNWKLV